MKAQLPESCDFALVDPDLRKYAGGDCSAAELREMANIYERWIKQLRFKADMMTQHTITGMFLNGHLGN